MNARNREDLVEVCRILAEQENLKVTVTHSAKGALLAGLGVFFGGLLGGPVGMAVGGSVTSIAAAVTSKGKFKSVVQVIKEMNHDQKARLRRAVKRALENTKPEDCVGLLTLALSSSASKEVILAELGRFLMSEFQMQMIR